MSLTREFNLDATLDEIAKDNSSAISYRYGGEVVFEQENISLIVGYTLRAGSPRLEDRNNVHSIYSYRDGVASLPGNMTLREALRLARAAEGPEGSRDTKTVRRKLAQAIAETRRDLPIAQVI